MKKPTKKGVQKPEEVKTPQNTDTVAPASPSTGEKTVNIPLSASNALQPEAGLQVVVPEEKTHEEIKTDPYAPQDTKRVAALNEGEPMKEGTPAGMENLQAVINEIFDRTNMDVSQRKVYRAKLGLQ